MIVMFSVSTFQRPRSCAGGGCRQQRPRPLLRGLVRSPIRPAFSLAASLRDGGELCVCDLAWISGRPQNLVSHHLRALKQEGLAASRRDGKIVFYSLSDVGVELLDGVLEATDASQAPIEAAR